MHKWHLEVGSPDHITLYSMMYSHCFIGLSLHVLAIIIEQGLE